MIIWIIIHIAVLVRILTRPHREPASRIAWVLVVMMLPVLGLLVYIAFGEVNIGRRRVRKLDKIIKALRSSQPEMRGTGSTVGIPDQYVPVFATGRSINGFSLSVGNTAQLPADSNVSIDAIVADIDAAAEHVHLSFYIWLTDTNGLKIVEALKRAAARGVTCRVMADDIGSRDMLHSAY